MKAVLVGMGLALASLANAHPLGNNTVNRQAGLALSPTTLTLDYRVDIAEIPTLLATTEADTDGDGSTSKAEWARYARAYAERIHPGITLRADGAPLTLHLDAARAALASGAVGLNTLLILARFSAPLQAQAGMKLTYQDQREPEQPGWKEVYFRAASGLEVRVSDVPAASQSRNLTVYPAGMCLMCSPPRSKWASSRRRRPERRASLNPLPRVSCIRPLPLSPLPWRACRDPRLRSWRHLTARPHSRLSWCRPLARHLQCRATLRHPHTTRCPYGPSSASARITSPSAGII